MSLFSTRNSDGASSLAESINNVSKAEMDRIRAQAVKHNPAKASLFTKEAAAYRKTHDPRKAGTN